VTFNGTNDHTDYKTGTEAHFEASIERIFSPKFSAGLQAYRFVQLSGDSGTGAVLGPNKGRVTGIGATAAYNFPLGKMPATARLRVFEEFEAERRSRDLVMLSLTVPLSMKAAARRRIAATKQARQDEGLFILPRLTGCGRRGGMRAMPPPLFKHRSARRAIRYVPDIRSMKSAIRRTWAEAKEP
jgi:hypothetical protein